MPRWARITITLAAVFVTCLVYAIFFGAQTISMLEVRHMASKAPVIDRVPVPLQDLSVSQATGTKLSYFGYSLEILWNDVDPTRGKIWTNRVVVAFKSGNAMMLTSVPGNDFVNGIATSLHVTPEKLREGFGDQVRSDYAFKTLILNVTPKWITFRRTWRQCTSISMLLMFKAVMLPSQDIDLFSFQTKDFKGFQFGDPKRRPPRIAVELYSDQGELEFYFFQTQGGKAPAISQADLNRIIHTIHKEPSSPALGGN